MGIRAKSKYIQDPLYGMVYLSDVEMRVIDSQAFQRLLSVKQLGYAYAVFPGADYSRFSHCVGVCHNMGAWIETLRKDDPVDPALAVLYRLAALLHDIGHYPFSHATERAAKNHYRWLLEENAASESPKDVSELPAFLDHEGIGGFIIENDPELKEAVLDAGLSSHALKRVYKRQAIDPMSVLISSDLDADRLDFLRRSAYHSGLPYGNVDYQYLITQLHRDDEKRMYWDQKALGAIDHLYLARYFDYLQIVHNKTVVALELVLEFLVEEMLRQKVIDLSQQFVKTKLERREWIQVDDHFMFARIRALQDQSSDQAIKDLCDSLLSRNPPRMLYSYSFVGGYERVVDFEMFKTKADLKVKELADSEGIDRRLCFVWGRPFNFTKYRGGPNIDHNDEGTKQEMYEVPRITGNNGTSIPVLDHPMSLSRLFYTKRQFELRVYVLLPELIERNDNKSEARRRDLTKKFEKAIGAIRIETLGAEPHKKVEWTEGALFSG